MRTRRAAAGSFRAGSQLRTQTEALTLPEMPPDVRTTSLAMGQEADMPGALEDLEPGAGMAWASSFWPCTPDTMASLDPASTKVGTSIFQSRSEISNVSSWARRWAITLWSVSQIRSMTKSARGPGSGFTPCSRLKNWLTKRVVRGQGKPLQHSAGNRRADRASETGRRPPARSEHPGLRDAQPPAPGQWHLRTKRQRPRAAPALTAQSRSQGPGVTGDVPDRTGVGRSRADGKPSPLRP